jgi:prenyltransferase beta subunit
MLALSALVGVVLGAAPLRAADTTVKMDETARKAVEKALEWLASQQQSNGAWGDGRYPHNTAVTAFTLLAFMSNGHLPGQGLYGPEVAKGVRFLIASARPGDGYLVGARGGNMYCHGMATLALAEAWGQTQDEEIKPVLIKAVELIVRCQNHEGGWRYEPQPTAADISVTIMQVMALRAAKNSGLHVPDQTLKRALEYIQRCYEPATGAFRYQPQSRGPGFARTAAGLCVLQLSGKYDAEQIPRGVKYLQENFNSRTHFWYGHYYAAHVMHQVGGNDWAEWYKKIRNLLLARQAANGSWTGSGLGSDDGVGPTFSTSIACIILATPAGYLPIFQR